MADGVPDPVGELIGRHGLHAEPFGPVGIWRIAVQEGWLVGLRPNMGTVLADGIVLTAASGLTKCLFVNDTLDGTWQRYAIAHELAHEALGHSGVFTRRLGQLDTALEVAADEAAARILVPDGLLHLGADALARACDVPLGVARRRLQAVGLEIETTWKDGPCARGLLRPF